MPSPSPSFSFTGFGSLEKGSFGVAETITAALDDDTGVDVVEWSIVATDELSAGEFDLTPAGTSVTFSSGDSRGRAGILKCKINNGINKVTQRADPASTEATAKFFVPTLSGVEVLCTGETTQSDGTFGWIAPVNEALRLIGPRPDMGEFLTDSNQTIYVSDNNWRILDHIPLTAHRVVTLSPTGAVEGDRIEITKFDTSAFTLTIANGGPGGGNMFILPAAEMWGAISYFNGSDWIVRSANHIP